MVDWETTTEIFAEGSEPANRPVETRRPLPELDEEVEDRLADIGYLG
jgi:hypothetical protein